MNETSMRIPCDHPPTSSSHLHKLRTKQGVFSQSDSCYCVVLQIVEPISILQSGKQQIMTFKVDYGPQNIPRNTREMS